MYSDKFELLFFYKGEVIHCNQKQKEEALLEIVILPC